MWYNIISGQRDLFRYRHYIKISFSECGVFLAFGRRSMLNFTPHYLYVGIFVAMENYNCKTKYPVFLIHGMGFRDGKIVYWGRIPHMLRKWGADVYFGYQDANG